MLRVRLVIGPSKCDHAGPDETSDVVDVAVGLIAIGAGAKPEHLLDAEVVAEMTFDLLARQRRVAIRVQQALFGSEACAFTIYMNRAAFEDQRRFVGLVAFKFDHLRGDLRVQIPVWVEAAFVATPSVELPVDATPLTVGVGDEGRANVAHPGVVAVEFDDLDACWQQSARTLKLRPAYTHPQRLSRSDRSSHLSVSLLRRAALLSPRVTAVRPEHPGGLVRGELGRHREAVGCRRAAQGIGHQLDPTGCGPSLASEALKQLAELERRLGDA